MTLLRPFINEKFIGPIWRMEIDELSDTIFVEIRIIEEKKVQFGSISLVSGEVYFKDFKTPERWLTGIEAAYDGVLLLHNYQSETAPAHKGIIAVDAFNAEVLWSNYTYTFDHLSNKGPIVFNSNILPKKLVLADIKTGIVKRNYEPAIDSELNNSIVAPQEVHPDFLKHVILPVQPFTNVVHYLDYNNLRIVSLHTLIEGQLQQHLYIMEGSDTVYKDLLNTDIQKIQPESFILRKNRLIYLKNRSALIAINL